MPRELRVRGDDIQYHIILRCNNREHLLQDPDDFIQALDLLRDCKKRFGFKLYNYDILHAHIHLMLSTHGDYFIDHIMHDFCFKYAQDFNRRHRRSGHLWAQRYRSRLILNDHHGIGCLRYQHRNALSVGLVTKPEDWPWSGYCHYAFGVANDLLEMHPSYLALAEGDVLRKKIYRELVNTPIPSDKILNLLEKGDDKQTRRFNAMVKQVARLKRKITI